MVDGERQVGSVSGDAWGDSSEASLSAVHFHLTPVVGLTNITWQSFWVRNASCRCAETTPQGQQCHTHLCRNTGVSLRNERR